MTDNSLTDSKSNEANGVQSFRLSYAGNLAYAFFDLMFCFLMSLPILFKIYEQRQKFALDAADPLMWLGIISAVWAVLLFRKSFIYAFCVPNKVDISSEGIQVKTFFGKIRTVRWEEISKVRKDRAFVGASVASLKLYSSNGRLLLRLHSLLIKDKKFIRFVEGAVPADHPLRSSLAAQG